MNQAGTSRYRPEDMVNRPPLAAQWRGALVQGNARLVEFISGVAAEKMAEGNSGTCRIAIDAHLGVPWGRLIPDLQAALQGKNLDPVFRDIASCMRSPGALEKMLRPCLPDDPTFGRLFSGTLADFYDGRKVSSLRKELRSSRRAKGGAALPRVMVCYGSGAAGPGLRNCYDVVFYIDLTREEILKRTKMGLACPLGMEATKKKTGKAAAGNALPAYFSTRRFYYVDYPVLDKHRRRLLPRVDYYIDGNVLDEPKLLPGDVLQALLDLLVSGPIKAKPYYDPSPWGGQWLKRVRNLPHDMSNCAWSYDLIEPESSLQVAWGKTRLELPFPLLASQRPQNILGQRGRRRKFRGQFPIRINYDDGFEGGDMALQSHPGDAYIKKHFNEAFRQDESYYIVDTAPGSSVYLGLRDQVSVEAFRRAVVRAEKRQVPFDHTKYVNRLPSRPGDLFLIPAGTLHGSGQNETVLEISATTYRYTFHFYDYLRPGLDGRLRPIHSKHAFAALKTHRRTRWVEAHLKQEPRRVRSGRGWAEYLLGTRHDMFFKVHRLEFERAIKDDTGGEFHLLVVVAGEGIRIRPHRRPDLVTRLPFSCLSLVPATLGPYTLEAVGKKPCKVVKVLMA